jgi:L-alanine-DL-glutamate epimerase-like enolase superfamily enzyme
LRITSVKSSLLSVPTEKLITDSIHSLERVEVVACEVETDSGLTGFGFTYTIGVGGYAIKATVDSIIAKILAGCNPLETEEIWRKMWEKTHAVGRGGITTHAIAAADIALWDLKGKNANKPLYRLLNGSKRGIPLYDTNGGWLHYSEGELEVAAKDVLKNKFCGFKIKVGKKTLEEDVHRIESVKKILGRKALVMLDANQVWSKSEALRRGRAFQDLGVYWFEEPVIADDLFAHSEIAKALDLPIAVGETLFSKYEFLNYIKLGACDILQQDVCRVGGITEWLEIARMAEENGLKVSPHFVMDLHVSLVASIRNGLFVEYIPWLRKLFRSAPMVEEGKIYPSEAPGIGLELDESAFKKYVVQ